MAQAYLVAMKHFLPTLTLLLALLSSAVPAAPLRPAAPVAPASGRPTETMLVCMSKKSYAYHSSDRRQGLNRCTHEVKTMSAADA